MGHDLPSSMNCPTRKKSLKNECPGGGGGDLTASEGGVVGGAIMCLYPRVFVVWNFSSKEWLVVIVTLKAIRPRNGMSKG